MNSNPYDQLQKSNVVEFVSSTSMQDISLAEGVGLVEKGKVTKGNDLSVSGRLNLQEYKKMVDPR